MSDAAGARSSTQGSPTGADLFRERPIIPLLGLLALLVVVSQIVRPGIVTPEWAAVIMRTAVPLAILAGCQTLTMLTGGIDLSVGAVGSMSGFVVATFINSPGACRRGSSSPSWRRPWPASSPASASGSSGSTR